MPHILTVRMSKLIIVHEINVFTLIFKKGNLEAVDSRGFIFVERLRLLLRLIL